MFSESKEKPNTAYEKAKIATDTKLDESHSSQKELSSPISSEQQKKCVIFITDKASKSGSNMTITKILEKYEGREEFLTTKVKGRDDEQFKKDVNDACNGKKPENHPKDKDVSVYVYEDRNRGVYSTPLQKKEGAKDTAIQRNSSQVSLP